MNSVLGKLIQKEFGRNKYKIYCSKLDQKECMDIFCDIYLDLNLSSDEHLSDRLLNLLRTVQLSVKILFLHHGGVCLWYTGVVPDAGIAGSQGGCDGSYDGGIFI